ncbi:MAG: hypothetical protein CMK23_05145 [Porticoccaceae bacterium]|nr:hypothetical protein [Porticoccaceae bacterium]|tara:strand:- start:3708 stop:3887 length:180 start_codon:yes stop_codon:yes gene_type:complete
MLENNGREVIASIIDDMLSGRDYHAMENVKDILTKNSAQRIAEIKKDHAEEMFKAKDEI